MADIDKTEIKRKIEAEIVKTEKQVKEYSEMTKPVEPENAIGRISRMDAINNKSVTEAALRKAKQTLDNLYEALKKVDSPEFGICMVCKKPIPAGRILIMPQALVCVSCSR